MYVQLSSIKADTRIITKEVKKTKETHAENEIKFTYVMGLYISYHGVIHVF